MRMILREDRRIRTKPNISQETENHHSKINTMRSDTIWKLKLKVKIQYWQQSRPQSSSLLPMTEGEKRGSGDENVLAVAAKPLRMCAMS